MTISTSILVEEDATILLERALLGKTVCAFGEDGLGKHGQHDRASWFVVKSLEVEINVDDEDAPTEIAGVVSLLLEDYSSEKLGHIATDRNFDISIGALLKKEEIDPKSLVWPDDIDYQGDDYVTLDINIPLLMGWP